MLLLLHAAAGVYFNGYPPGLLVIIALLYLLLLILGSTFIQWNFYLKSVNKIPSLKLQFSEGRFDLKSRGKDIALTFDDGPADYTESILDTLKKEQVQATFFLIGQHIAAHRAVVRRIYDEGHTLGNHSFYHGRNFDWKSSTKMQLELEQTNEAIEAITGTKVKLFRPPYGVTTPNLAKAVRNTQLKSIGWNVRSFDTIAKDEGKLLRKIIKKVKPGSILLLHDRCAITARILPALLQTLKKEGYNFRSVD